MSLITQSELRRHFRYDSASGELIWMAREVTEFNSARIANAWNSRCAGKAAGTRHPKGYIQIRYKGRSLQAHVLIWIWMTGEAPNDKLIDHWDGDGCNNRWVNLRLVTHQGNARNTGISSRNKSGFGGVSWYAPYSKWRAVVKMNGKQTHLGYFADAAVAAATVSEFRGRHGFTARHGT